MLIQSATLLFYLTIFKETRYVFALFFPHHVATMQTISSAVES